MCAGTACSLLTDTGGLAGEGPPDGAAYDAFTLDVTGGPDDGDARATDAADGASDPADTALPQDAGDAAEGAAPPTYRDAVLADAPIAYWRFGEPSGTVAHDESGHGNDASLGGGITWGAAGALVGDADTAIRLDGTDGLDAGTRFDFAGNDPYSLEAWLRPEAIDNTYRHLYSKDDQSRATGREQYGVFVQASEGLAYERWVAGGSAKVVAPLPALNRWIHVVGTYDGSKMTLYVDGAVVAVRLDTRAQLTKPVTEYVGCKAAQSGVIRGALDEMAIYDHALTSDRVTAHKTASRR
jgi:hypothetical protein